MEKVYSDGTKIVAIGVNSEQHRCTCIYSKATFAELEEDYDKYYKRYSATNWGGSDDAIRTVLCEGLSLTGKSFKREVTVNGTDNDMGHKYDWTFHFDLIFEAKQNLPKVIPGLL